MWLYIKNKNKTKIGTLPTREMVMKLITKKLETSNEWICYLRDENDNNLSATLGKSLTEATAKMLDDICFELIGPATQKTKFVS